METTYMNHLTHARTVKFDKHFATPLAFEGPFATTSRVHVMVINAYTIISL